MGLGYLNTDGSLDLIVSMRYDATAGPPALGRWQCLLDEASKLLHQATGGAARLGKVYFANNLAGSMTADMYAFNDPTRDWSAPSQTTCQGLFDPYFGSPGFAIGAGREGVRSPYLLLRELGRYAFALRDEMVGSDRRCTGQDFGPACIMEFDDGEYGTAIVPPCTVVVAGATNKTRFCTPEDSATALDTEHLSGGATTNPQHTCHGVSCRETIEAFTTTLSTPIVIPVPTQDPANAAPPIDWIEMDQTPRIVLALDRSFSMLTNQAFVGVQQAAHYWIDLEAMIGHPSKIGIVTYNHNATQTWPAIPFKIGNLEPNHVGNAKQFVTNAVQPAGATDIAGALNLAGTLIMDGGPPDLAAEQAIVLFTDGHQTVPGKDPLDELPALRENFIRVFPIGMGPDADIDRPVLEQIAHGTKGIFQQITDPDAPIDPTLPTDPVVAATAEIMDALIHLSAVLHSGLVLVEPAVLREEGGGEESYGFVVEKGAEALTVVVRRTPTDPVELAVIPPGEDSFLEAGDHPKRGWRHTNPSGSPYTLFVAEDPRPGEWQVRVRTSGAEDAPVKTFAFVSNKGFVVGLLGAAGVHDVEEAPRLVVRVDFGGTVTGLTTAVVRTPDGEPVADFAEQSDATGTYVATLPIRDPGTYEYFVELGNEGTAEVVRARDAAKGSVPRFRRLERVLIRVDRVAHGAA